MLLLACGRDARWNIVVDASRSSVSGRSGGRYLQRPFRGGIIVESGEAVKRGEMAQRVRAAGIILVGGRATRLGGQPKGFVEVGGQTLLQRAQRALEAVVDEVVVVAREAEPYRSCAARVVTDRVAGEGPLMGLEAGLQATSRPLAVVVACDLPFLSAPVLGFLVERLRRQLAGPGAPAAVVPEWEGRPQPLHAVYRRERTLGAVERCLAEGQRSLRALLGRLSLDVVTARELAAVAGTEMTFFNLNTPDDLARARRLAEGAWQMGKANLEDLTQRATEITRRATEE
jgi:molybdopterin-guanine dinucleotide biosynthesis protein A